MSVSVGTREFLKVGVRIEETPQNKPLSDAAEYAEMEFDRIAESIRNAAMTERMRLAHVIEQADRAIEGVPFATPEWSGQSDIPVLTARLADARIQLMLVRNLILRLHAGTAIG